MIWVTGAAGFVGFHVARALLARGERVVGIDSLNDYYDVSLKEARRDRLLGESGFEFHQLDLAEQAAAEALFASHPPARVVHLAAQAGVRYSLDHPHAYLRANLDAFLNVLEGCRHGSVDHLVYASSSSVYGANRTTPFSEHHHTEHPVSLYAATKKANEAMAHSYSHLYGLPTTGLRFFTCYGPWGRPDMALFIFTKAILAGEPIPVFNRGDMRRDFTYIDDIVTGVVNILDRPAAPDPAWDAAHPDPATSNAPYRVYNIGHSEPVQLTRMIAVLEEALGAKAIVDLQPMQPGDVLGTCADVSDLERDAGFRPGTPIEEGIARFVEWYREYYGV